MRDMVVKNDKFGKVVVYGCLLLLTANISAATVGELREKAAALVAQMTVDEKCAQLRNEAPAIPRLGIPAYNYWGGMKVPGTPSKTRLN